ncbi:N-acetylmuramic acid/N-acetylglucosamine kinase [bacterium HR21]|nr:N-acetylmuramic acid/N-acetylglucosamine kinase [bacterium HR21]
MATSAGIQHGDAVEPEGPVLAGIDGGGSRTRVAVTIAGQQVASLEIGTVRIGAVGIGEACERLVNALVELREQTGVIGYDAVVAGIAGVWLPEERQRVEQVLRWMARERRLLLGELRVVSDAEIALEGALAGKPGVVLIAGTGTIAVGRTPSGQLVRCGGWGIELDDEGSGAWIGREGLTAVVRALDGRGQPTCLAQKLAELYPSIRLEQPRTIVAAYNERLFEYPTLTPLVMACAQEGDAVCRAILERAAAHLVELLLPLRRHFPRRPIPLSLLGGMLENHTLLARLFREQLAGVPDYRLQAPKGTSLDGAFALADRLLSEKEP